MRSASLGAYGIGVLTGFGLGIAVGMWLAAPAEVPIQRDPAIVDELLVPPIATTRALAPHFDAVRTAQIVRHAEAVDVDPYLVAAIILVESKNDPYAVSRVGAIGLMQVMPYHWHGAYPDCGQDLFDPDVNICYGTRILAHYLRVANSTADALDRYSGGARRYAEKVANHHATWAEGL